MQLGVRKYFQAIIGITLIGVGVAFNYLANLGLGPWGVFENLVISRPATAQVIVIHGRKVVMDERHGVDHLQRRRRGQS